MFPDNVFNTHVWEAATYCLDDRAVHEESLFYFIVSPSFRTEVNEEG